MCPAHVPGLYVQLLHTACITAQLEHFITCRGAEEHVITSKNKNNEEFKEVPLNILISYTWHPCRFFIFDYIYTTRWFFFWMERCETSPCEYTVPNREAGSYSSNWNESWDVASLPSPVLPALCGAGLRLEERRLCTTVVIGPDL